MQFGFVMATIKLWLWAKQWIFFDPSFLACKMTGLSNIIFKNPAELENSTVDKTGLALYGHRLQNHQGKDDQDSHSGHHENSISNKCNFLKGSQASVRGGQSLQLWGSILSSGNSLKRLLPCTGVELENFWVLVYTYIYSIYIQILWYSSFRGHYVC